MPWLSNLGWSVPGGGSRGWQPRFQIWVSFGFGFDFNFNVLRWFFYLAYYFLIDWIGYKFANL